MISSKTAEIVEAEGLRKQMTSFNFVLMLTFQCKILERVNLTSKTLQNPNIFLDEAVNLLQKCLEQLTEMKNCFGEILEEAKEIAENWKIETTLQNKRKRRIKTFFDELTEDFEFKDPIYNFKVRVFNAVIDTLIGQINQRFESLKNINVTFSFLSPKYLTEKSDKELVESARKFYEKIRVRCIECN